MHYEEAIALAARTPLRNIEAKASTYQGAGFMAKNPRSPNS